MVEEKRKCGLAAYAACPWSQKPLNPIKFAVNPSRRETTCTILFATPTISKIPTIYLFPFQVFYFFFFFCCELSLFVFRVAHIEAAIRAGRVRSGQVKIGPIFSGLKFNSPIYPKIQADRVKLPCKGKFLAIGPGQICLEFFQANNLMVKPIPNSELTRLTYRAKPKLPHLLMSI